MKKMLFLFIVMISCHTQKETSVEDEIQNTIDSEHIRLRKELRASRFRMEVIEEAKYKGKNNKQAEAYADSVIGSDADSAIDKKLREDVEKYNFKK